MRMLSTATRYTARWKGPDLLVITVPRSQSKEQILDVIEKMRPDILTKRPAKQFFGIGWTYDIPECHFEVQRGDKPNCFVRYVSEDKSLVIFRMPPGYPEEGGEAFNDYVNKNLKEYAKVFGPRLLEKAVEIGRRLGVTYRSLDMARGERVLGKCNARKEITFSYNLIYYPEELRELVIAHEFAHLTHLNHSAAFYALLDTYLNGRHAALRRALNAHRLPYIK